MKQSAGILLYKKGTDDIEFFLIHPGGPFYRKKEEGWWSIPKGELLTDEDPLDAAIREFEEETGYKPSGTFTELTPIVQKGGKKVYCWANEGNIDAATIISNTFEMEWPPKSGKYASFPEVDKAGWFNFNDAKLLINERQAAFLVELIDALGKL